MPSNAGGMPFAFVMSFDFWLAFQFRVSLAVSVEMSQEMGFAVDWRLSFLLPVRFCGFIESSVMIGILTPQQ